MRETQGLGNPILAHDDAQLRRFFLVEITLYFAIRHIVKIKWTEFTDGFRKQEKCDSPRLFSKA